MTRAAARLVLATLAITSACRVTNDLPNKPETTTSKVAREVRVTSPATTPQDIPGVPPPKTPPRSRQLPSAPAALPPGELPASDRIFAVNLPRMASNVVLGADADALWSATPVGPGHWREQWRVQGPGAVQLVALGNIGGGPKLFVVWGTGRGFLDAPLVLQSLDPATGAATELWRNQGERNDATHLSVDDVDRDGKPELAFAYFSSKYMVRTRHIELGGKAIEGPEIRMATSRAYGDLDGDGLPDEALGRSYGDDRDKPGDLRVNLGKGWVTVPTDKGVRAVLIAKLGDDAAPTLYFADGWVANYGKEAKAHVKRARWRDGAFQVDLVARSADEYGFSGLEALDLDGDGKLELVAEGNLRVSAFDPSGELPWASRELAKLEPVLNVAIARDSAGVFSTLIPGRPTTKVVPVPR